MTAAQHDDERGWPHATRMQISLPVGQMFEELLFAPLHWPWKVVRLEQDSFEDFRQRSFSASVSVSELFHENSKLFPQTLPRLAATRVDDDIRRDFVVRRANAWSSGHSPVSVAPALADFLAGLVAAGEPELYYAVELRLVIDGSLTIYEPKSNTLHLVRHVHPPELAAARQALRLLAPPWVAGSAGHLLCVVGFFGRNEMLLGPRGYRRTVLDAGQVAGHIVAEGQRRGWSLRPIYEFVDRDVDIVVDADGTEVAALVGFDLPEELHVG